VSGNSAQAENDAGVLNSVIRVVPHDPYGPYIGQHRACNQPFEPVRSNDLSVIVQKTQDFAEDSFAAQLFTQV